jgi:hypothetical protein
MSSELVAHLTPVLQHMSLHLFLRSPGVFPYYWECSHLDGHLVDMVMEDDCFPIGSNKP